MINESVFREILPFTVQLFRKKSSIEPVDLEPWASAFLLEANGNYYLCTASHVYKDANYMDVGFCVGADFYIIEGEISLLKVTESPENDKADIAVCKLTNESVEDLKQKYTFLDFNSVELNHRISSSNKYLVCGYPLTKSKKNKKKRTIKSIPLKLSTKAYIDPKRYERIQRDIKANIVLEYRRFKLYNFLKLRVIAPKPTGISGGGLWCHVGADLKLVGIMTEWISEEAVLVATKIDVLISMIRFRFDQTLPESKTVNSKFEKNE